MVTNKSIKVRYIIGMERKQIKTKDEKQVIELLLKRKYSNNGICYARSYFMLLKIEFFESECVFRKLKRACHILEKLVLLRADVH